jgi:hypothetical protein
MKAAEDHQGALDASLLQINGILHQARVTQEVTHRHVNVSAIRDGPLSLARVSVKLDPRDWMAAIDSRDTNILDRHWTRSWVRDQQQGLGNG